MRGRRGANKKVKTTTGAAQTRTDSEADMYREYLNSKWSYYYTYPEYFKPEKIPNNSSGDTVLATTKHFDIIQPNSQGQCIIFFSPGLSTAHKTESKIGTAGFKPWFAFTQDVVQPVESWKDQFRHLEARANMSEIRCTGGFLSLTAPEGAKIRRCEGTIGPGNSLGSMITKAFVQSNSSTMLERYRVTRKDQFYSDSTHFEHRYYCYHLYSCPTNSSVSVSIELTLEGKLKDDKLQSFFHSEDTETDWETSKKIAARLQDKMPDALKHAPLLSAYEYKSFLFTGDHKIQRMFPEKTNLSDDAVATVVYKPTPTIFSYTKIEKAGQNESVPVEYVSKVLNQNLTQDKSKKSEQTQTQPIAKNAQTQQQTIKQQGNVDEGILPETKPDKNDDKQLEKQTETHELQENLEADNQRNDKESEDEAEEEVQEQVNANKPNFNEDELPKLHETRVQFRDRIGDERIEQLLADDIIYIGRDGNYIRTTENTAKEDAR